VLAAVRVLKLLFDELRDQFQLEIFGVSGCVTGFGGELGIRDSHPFRGRASAERPSVPLNP
jgi:hypothetical protein